MSPQHEEFPYLTDQALAAYRAAFPKEVDPFVNLCNRRKLSAFLLEAINQATATSQYRWEMLQTIAHNLHCPPPTLAQAREADLNTPEGKATVSAFLATLREGV